MFNALNVFLQMLIVNILIVVDIFTFRPTKSDVTSGIHTIKITMNPLKTSV